MFESEGMYVYVCALTMKWNRNCVFKRWGDGASDRQLERGPSQEWKREEAGETEGKSGGRKRGGERERKGGRELITHNKPPDGEMRSSGFETKESKQGHILVGMCLSVGWCVRLLVKCTFKCV